MSLINTVDVLSRKVARQEEEVIEEGLIKKMGKDDDEGEERKK